MMLVDFSHPFVDWLFPKRCLVCESDSAVEYLCPACAYFIHPIPRWTSGINKGPNAFFYFEATVKKALLKAKFQKDLACLYLILTMVKKEICEGALDNLRQHPPFDIISFIPSHWIRRSFRGAEISFLFAQLLSHELNIQLEPTLIRTRYFMRQTKILQKKDRRIAIKGAFRARKNIPLKKRLLLVDDIVTTSSTFTEAVGILRPFFKTITCQAIAKTP